MEFSSFEFRLYFSLTGCRTKVKDSSVPYLFYPYLEIYPSLSLSLSLSLCVCVFLSVCLCVSLSQGYYSNVKCEQRRPVFELFSPSPSLRMIIITPHVYNNQSMNIYVLDICVFHFTLTTLGKAWIYLFFQFMGKLDWLCYLALVKHSVWEKNSDFKLDLLYFKINFVSHSIRDRRIR